MKRFIGMVMVVMVLASCATSRSLTIDVEGVPETHVFQPYGAFNMFDKNPDVRYGVSIGNLVWSALFCQTVIVPVVLMGWFMMEPIGTVDDSGLKGVR